MLDLLTPEAHRDAYEWAAVFLAHAFLGLVLVAIMAAILDRIAGEWITGTGSLALVIVALGFLTIWEGLAQGYGAGLADALVDAAAVTLGGLAGLSAWLRRGALLAGSILAAAVVTAAGVFARRRG